MMTRDASSDVPAGRMDRGMPQDRLRRGLLLDYYGALLSPRQRECCELHYNEDLSLSEIAETCGISRQGAWDNIRRGTEALEAIEARTGLLQRHEEMRGHLALVEKLLRQLLIVDAPGGDPCEVREREPACLCEGEACDLLRAAYDEISGLLKTEEG